MGISAQKCPFATQPMMFFFLDLQVLLQKQYFETKLVVILCKYILYFMYFNAILLTIHVFWSKIDTLFDAKDVL